MIEGVLTEVLMPCPVAHDPDEVIEWIKQHHDLNIDDDFQLIYCVEPAAMDHHQLYLHRDAADEEDRVDSISVFMTNEAYTKYKLGRDFIEEKFNLQPGTNWDELFGPDQ